MPRRLISLIVSRLMVAAALFAMAAVIKWYWNPSLELAPLWLFLAVVGLGTVGYALIMRSRLAYQSQAYIQVIGDVLLTSWLIYLMRYSDYSLVPLYLVIIFGSSMVLPRSGVIAVGLCCVAGYGGLLGLSALGIIKGGQNLTLVNQFYNPALFIAAMLVLTILGGQLAERLYRSDADLRTATQYLANLKAFNERIVQSINSGLLTTDLMGNIISFNRAAEEITGHRASRLRGRHFREVFGEGETSTIFDEGGRPKPVSRLTRFEMDCRTTTGKPIHLGFSTSALVTETGEITGYVFSFQDLTEIIKLEQEVRRRERLAALGKMAAGIAHEIRNPLAAMRGSIQLLRGEMDLTDDQAQLMQIVLRESDRLDRTITDFLAYARPSPLRPTEFDVAALVTETVTLLRNSPEVLPIHDIKVACPTATLRFTADPAQIKQVVWNLSRNAIQAMPEGGSLTIALRILPSGELEIRVSDTGSGMSEDQMERIFEPFNSSRVSGTGLGMAIVYQIVSDHQGTISVVSTPAGNGPSGTDITLRLPPGNRLTPPHGLEKVADSRSQPLFHEDDANPLSPRASR